MQGVKHGGHMVECSVVSVSPQPDTIQTSFLPYEARFRLLSGQDTRGRLSFSRKVESTRYLPGTNVDRVLLLSVRYIQGSLRYPKINCDTAGTQLCCPACFQIRARSCCRWPGTSTLSMAARCMCGSNTVPDGQDGLQYVCCDW